MSKYNHMQSIPVDSVPKDEINQAIKEWAEGDIALEKLLFACYQKGIKTSGCHAGSYPYIDFSYPNNLDKLTSILDTTQKTIGSQIYIMIDGGNPFAGEEWYKSVINVGLDTKYKEETDIYFDNLNKSLEKDINIEKHPLLDLLNFFHDKETGLSLRFKHKEDNSYVFDIEGLIISNERYKYYNDVFTKSGLIDIVNEQNNKRHEWKIESNNLEDILAKMNNVNNIIMSEYALEPETDETKIDNLTLLARLKKKNLNENEFNEWLIDEKKKSILELEKIKKNLLKNKNDEITADKKTI